MTADVRIQIRCSAEEKALYLRAAKSIGFKTLSQFVRVAAFRAARDTIPAYWPQTEKEAKQTPQELLRILENA